MYVFFGSPDRTHVAALLTNESVEFFDSWTVADGMSSDLVGRVMKLMGKSKTSFADLEGMIVVTGPGSFSFSRLGVVAANAFYTANEVPMVGIDRLQLGVLLARARGVDADRRVVSVVPTIHESWFVGEGIVGSEGIPNLEYSRMSSKELRERVHDVAFVGEGVSDLDPHALEYDWSDKEVLQEMLSSLFSLTLDQKLLEPQYILSPNIGKMS